MIVRSKEKGNILGLTKGKCFFLSKELIYVKQSDVTLPPHAIDIPCPILIFIRTINIPEKAPSLTAAAKTTT